MIEKKFSPTDHPLRKEEGEPLATRSEHKIVDEEILIRKTFERDPQAGCEILFQKYYAILCSHAIRFVHSREVAEDIVGEIFCKFWSDQLYTMISTSFRAYLFKAVRYSAYNYIRWELSKRQKTIDTENLHGAVSTMKPEEALLYSELSAEIDQVIAKLPNQCKRVFLLSRFEQKKYTEIAAELNISVKAVEANISRALTILRKTLKAEDFLCLLPTASLLFDFC